MHLTDLVPGPAAAHPDAGSIGMIDVTGISSDSRAIAPGHLFVALKGSSGDGRAYAAAAVEAGAVAILTDEREPDASLARLAESGVPVLTCTAPRLELAHAAARFWRRQPGMIAAVTGTNGKTSTVEFLRQIWSRVTWDAASIGTLGLQCDDPRKMQGSMHGLPPLTTPDAVSLHSALQPLTGAGVTHLAIEASSHGLAQHRLDGLNIHIAAFTNLSRDHLDHHEDMDSYFAAKSRLFTDLLLAGGSAVINIDDEYGAKLAASMRAADPRQHVVITVGQDKSADFRIADISPMDFGLEITVEHKEQAYRIRWRLPAPSRRSMPLPPRSWPMPAACQSMIPVGPSLCHRRGRPDAACHRAPRRRPRDRRLRAYAGRAGGRVARAAPRGERTACRSVRRRRRP